MNIYNQKEAQVFSLIDDIFGEEKEKREPAFCVCGQCRLDVACYVLNRVEPRYVISERGVAHTEGHYQAKIQETADLAALIHEGIDRVSSQKRPDFPHTGEPKQRVEQRGMMFFPMIKGRVFNGNTFEPVCNIDVFLNIDSEPVEMVDPNWQNPCHIYDNSSGSFYFLPKPFKPGSSLLDDPVRFEILIDDLRFEPLRHFFSISPTGSPGGRPGLPVGRNNTVNTSGGYSTEDLYLFEK